MNSKREWKRERESSMRLPYLKGKFQKLRSFFNCLIPSLNCMKYSLGSVLIHFFSLVFHAAHIHFAEVRMRERNSRNGLILGSFLPLGIQEFRIEHSSTLSFDLFS